MWVLRSIPTKSLFLGCLTPSFALREGPIGLATEMEITHGWC